MYYTVLVKKDVVWRGC